MTDNQANIILEPPVEKQVIFNNIRIHIVDLQLNTSATFAVQCFNGPNLIQNRTYTLAGDDYTKWDADDSYVVDYITQRLREEASLAQNKI